MSHFSKIQLKIKSMEGILNLLNGYGLEVQKNKYVKGYREQKMLADYKIKGKEIGFIQKEGLVEIIGDSYVEKEYITLKNRISQDIAYDIAKTDLEKKAYQLSGSGHPSRIEENRMNGKIYMRLYIGE